MTTEPQCNAPSTSAWGGPDLATLQALPERLNDDQLALCQRVADLAIPAMTPVDDEHFTRCMRMLTVLPDRKGDDLTAELRIALYRRHFGSYPREAWSHLTERATLTCKFFPSPQECKAILDQWNRSDGPFRAHQLAQTRVRNELQLRFTDLVTRLREGKVTQQEVDALPERWKRILAVQGFVRDVSYALRTVERYPVEGEQEQGQSPGVDADETGQADGKARRPDEGSRP